VRLDDVEAEAATAALEVLAEADANRSPRHVSTYLVSVGRIYPDTVRSPGVKPSRTRTWHRSGSNPKPTAMARRLPR